MSQSTGATIASSSRLAPTTALSGIVRSNVASRPTAPIDPGTMPSGEV
jgi:hypothetical protein